jgi:hypothetical protein
MSKRVTLKLKSPIEANGTSMERTEVYEVTEMPDGTLSLWGMHPTKDPSVWVRGSAGYSGVPSLVAFSAERQRDNDAAAARASQAVIDERERQARKAESAPTVQRIQAAFDLQRSDWEYRMWEQVGEDLGRLLVAFCSVEMSHADAKRRDIALRKLLKPLVSDAKANAREEYPEDYREAEDKDDFYGDYIDDIATHIVDNTDWNPL